jgi:CheY-specific phosphatase CheX
VMGGMEMISKIRSRSEFKKLPILVVSTEASQVRIAEIKALEAHFIHKPFNPAQLRETLQKCHDQTPVSSPQKALREVGQDVFESVGGLTMAPDAATHDEKLDVRALVRFAGPFCGAVALDVPESLMLLLANTMLGFDLGFPDSNKQMDTLGELTNVICGNLLVRLAGNQAVFNLEPPQIVPVPGESEESPAGRRRISVLLNLEEGRAKLTLIVDQTASEGTPH